MFLVPCQGNTQDQINAHSHINRTVGVTDLLCVHLTGEFSDFGGGMLKGMASQEAFNLFMMLSLDRGKLLSILLLNPEKKIKDYNVFNACH